MSAEATDVVRLPSPVRWSGVPIGLAILVCLMALHIAVGAKQLSLSTVFEALTARDAGTFDHMIVWDLRLPRALIAMTVGAALSVAGALMQGVTRNPLAEPGILGLLAGASFAVVVTTFVFGSQSIAIIPWIGAAGALGAAVLVYLIAYWAPPSP
jgi:iron complex transport system permease protein